MLIESLNKRPKAPITFDANDQWPKGTYYFTPVDPADPTSAHVAEVEDPAHIGRLLSIVEGYRVYQGPAQKKAVATTAPKKAAEKPPVVVTAQADAPTDAGASSAPPNEF